MPFSCVFPFLELELSSNCELNVVVKGIKCILKFFKPNLLNLMCKESSFADYKVFFSTVTLLKQNSFKKKVLFPVRDYLGGWWIGVWYSSP